MNSKPVEKLRILWKLSELQVYKEQAFKYDFDDEVYCFMYSIIIYLN